MAFELNFSPLLDPSADEIELDEKRLASPQKKFTVLKEFVNSVNKSNWKMQRFQVTFL